MAPYYLVTYQKICGIIMQKIEKSPEVQENSDVIIQVVIKLTPVITV